GVGRCCSMVDGGGLMNTRTGNVIPLFGNAGPGPAAPHEAYRLEPDTEAALVARVCQDPAMWAKLGRHLDPTAMGLPGAREALEAAQRIVRERGRPSKSIRDIVQVIGAMHAEGKVTLDLKAAVKNLLSTGQRHSDVEGVASTDEMLVFHMRPILQRRMRKEAARLAVDELTARGDGVRVTDLYEIARQVGFDTAGTDVSPLGVDTL